MKLLQQLVQIKSTSGHEENLADFILDYCRKKNIPAVRQEGNIIIHIPGKDSSLALIFNAHLDTVSPGDEDSWKYKPYGPGAGKIAGGKLYGLGASDDKAAIAAMLVLAETRWALPDLWFIFVIKEETDGSGTAAFLEWFTDQSANWRIKTYKYIAAIIGEPTDLAQVEIGHRGNAFLKLVTHGTTGHAAKTYEGKKLAIAQMLAAISRLEAAFKIWEKTYKDYFLGSPGLNITGINTPGNVLKKVPGICEATLDIRTTPKLHPQLMKLLGNLLGENIVIEEIHQPQPPGLTSPQSKIVRIFHHLLPEVPHTVSVGSTDLFQFTAKGIDAVVFGPGNMKSIHKENEYVELSKVEECAAIYKKIVDTF